MIFIFIFYLYEFMGSQIILQICQMRNKVCSNEIIISIFFQINLNSQKLIFPIISFILYKNNKKSKEHIQTESLCVITLWEFQ